MTNEEREMDLNIADLIVQLDESLKQRASNAEEARA